MWSDVKQDAKHVTDYQFRRCTIQLDRGEFAFEELPCQDVEDFLGGIGRSFKVLGTYRVPDAYAVLARQGRRRGGHLRRAAGGGIVVWSDQRPQSVYLAFPRTDLQVEIYDTSAARARRLAVTGAVEPIR
jgi:hypothetical protein